MLMTLMVVVVVTLVVMVVVEVCVILKMVLIYYLGGDDFDGGGWLQCTPVVRIKRPECILAELLGIAAWENLGWGITSSVNILGGGDLGWRITWVENEEEGVHKESQVSW